MEIQEKKIQDLKPAPYNPRKISDDALTGLENSLKRFGVVQPIIWNKRTGYVVGGHQRLKALEKLGEKKIQCIVVDLDETEEKALNVTLNNAAISGEFTADLAGLIDAICDKDEAGAEALALSDLISAEQAKSQISEFKPGKPPDTLWLMVGLPMKATSVISELMTYQAAVERHGGFWSSVISNE